MALGRKTDAVKELGGGKAAIMECDSAGSTIGVSWQVLPIISGTTHNDTTAKNSVTDEAGNTYFTYGAREVTLEMTFLQRDVDTLSFPVTTAGGKGKYFHLVYEMTQAAIDGNFEYACYGITQIDPTVTRTSPGNEIAWTFSVFPNDDELSVDASGWTSASQTLGTITVPAGEYYAFETIVAS